ncbi:MAG: hypothetical protein LJF30_15805 [Acidobacteria bacterium]|jgi:hypothetical protein|nr:hypothetical protein [Acidobacteriota bacterium]
MKRACRAPALVLALAPALSWADAPPAVDHQPALCTVPGKAISLCAAISDDGTVAAARLYFRRAGERYYSFVDMSFTGISYCGTLPPPRKKKTKAIEYYVQAIDDQYEPARTSTFRLPVEPEGVCEFPPLEETPERAAEIKVFATSRKQGKKLDDGFLKNGVTFVPVKK